MSHRALLLGLVCYSACASTTRNNVSGGDAGGEAGETATTNGGSGGSGLGGPSSNAGGAAATGGSSNDSGGGSGKGTDGSSTGGSSTGGAGGAPPDECERNQMMNAEGECVSECLMDSGSCDCVDNSDCDGSYYCTAGLCAKKKETGSHCDSNSECDSASCIDDVCCESACDLNCLACSSATTGLADGTCGPRASSNTRACPEENPTVCVDLDADAQNCGMCGNSCPSPGVAGATAACTEGECSAVCPPGTIGDGVNVCIPVTTIAAADKFTCGLLETGKVSCWGDTSGGIEPASAGVSNHTFTSISARFDHVCGLSDTGQVVCWGASPSTHAGPYIAVATGDYHTCAIRANRTLQCWSSDGDSVIEAAPSGTYKGIVSMNHYSCAIIAGGADDGKLRCWGDSSNYSFRAPPTDEVFTSVISGANHGCGIKPDQTIMCWGLLYYPDFPASTVFKELGNGGSTHYCGILSDDTIFCWGSDEGIGGDAASEPAGTFKSLALGGSHTCGITGGGRVVCAGNNTYGQSANQPGPFQAW
jgi:hypothetical protein